MQKLTLQQSSMPCWTIPIYFDDFPSDQNLPQGISHCHAKTRSIAALVLLIPWDVYHRFRWLSTMLPCAFPLETSLLYPAFLFFSLPCNVVPPSISWSVLPIIDGDISTIYIHIPNSFWNYFNQLSQTNGATLCIICLSIYPIICSLCPYYHH